MTNVNNVNVESIKLLPTPQEVKSQFPLSEQHTDSIYQHRTAVQNILSKQDKRLMMIIGPCSIHDTKAAIEYAQRLKALSDKVSDELFIVMRVYFEKPRTTVGWKGLINDPDMNDSFHIEKGLNIARELMLQITDIGLPIGTEALDPITPQYIADLISWFAIGARTTESQTHREMASGLSAPVGFKNGTDGSIETAINAMKSAASPHNFLGINQEGRSGVIRTRGNKYGHVVLRGGNGQPNYDSVSIALIDKSLEKAKLNKALIVDCSHANSHKKHELQPLVLEDCINQVIQGNQSIVGFMLESNLNEGNQSIPEDLSKLAYGTSVTDACINWETTEKVIMETYKKIKAKT